MASTTADTPAPPTANEVELPDRQYQPVDPMAAANSTNAAGPVLGDAAAPADLGAGCCDGGCCFSACDPTCCLIV